MQAGLDCVLRVFGLNDGDGHIPFVHEQVVGLLGLLSSMKTLANDDFSIGEVIFSEYLPVGVPFFFERWVNQLQAHV